LAVLCDVSREQDNRAAVAAALREFGGLDVVVLNAGVSSGGPLDGLTPEAYRRAVGVNLDGVVLGLQAALPALVARGGGRVIVTASLAALAPVPLDPVYAATKAAVVHLVRSVAPAYLARGILVNALCPGFADTAIVDPLRDLLAASGIPLMPVEEVVDAFGAVLGSDVAGEAWLVQHGRPAEPYRFGGVPAPRL
jgi:NAD(P)-dependent dehydrogenase (short-subunit alcohol dehydrogenase family)